MPSLQELIIHLGTKRFEFLGLVIAYGQVVCCPLLLMNKIKMIALFSKYGTGNLSEVSLRLAMIKPSLT